MQQGNGNPTAQKIQAARAKNLYYPVGRLTGSGLMLSGAPLKWKKDPNVIYNSDFHLVGEPQDVYNAITSLINSSAATPNTKFTDQEARDSINRSYTLDNYDLPQSQGGLAEEYQREVDYVFQLRQQAVMNEAAPTFTLNDLEYIIPQLTRAPKVRRPTGTGPSSVRSPGRIKSIVDRINGLEAGKVLDVTNLMPNGSGTISIVTPGPASKKLSVQGVPIVSSNYDNYVRAVREAGYPNADEIIAEYSRVFNRVNSTTVGSPARAVINFLPAQQALPTLGQQRALPTLEQRGSPTRSASPIRQTVNRLSGIRRPADLPQLGGGSSSGFNLPRNTTMSIGSGDQE